MFPDLGKNKVYFQVLEIIMWFYMLELTVNKTRL